MTGATVKLGATPLMYACQQGKDSQVYEIIKSQPDTILERERSLKTALHYCAESGDGGVESAAALIKAAPELLSAQDQDGYTALHLAVIAGNLSLAKLLISHGIDVNTPDNEGHTSTHWATVCGEMECLEVMLRSGGDPNRRDMHGGCPLHYAAQMCGPGSEMGADRRLGMTGLRLLIGNAADPNVPDHHGRQPILWAASAGSSEAILVLTNAGANVEAADKDGLTALHCAASRGHMDCVETLVSLCNAEADVIDHNGCSALFYAVTLGHASCTQALLNHGANTNRQDRKGRTAMHCGAAKGQMETLKVVWERGGNLWQRTARGDYPLHEAVSSGRVELVRWLLSLRPDTVNSPNNDGRCPLHISAIHNNVEMSKVLLDAGSLVNPVMRTGKGLLATPLDAALHKGHRGTAKFLQLHGGVPAGRLNSESAALRGTRHAIKTSKEIEEGPITPVKFSGEQHQRNIKLPPPKQKVLQVYVEDNVVIKRIKHPQLLEDDRVRRRRRKRKTRQAVDRTSGMDRDKHKKEDYENSSDEAGDTSHSSVMDSRLMTESETEAIKKEKHLYKSEKHVTLKMDELETSVHLATDQGEIRNSSRDLKQYRELKQQDSEDVKKCVHEVEVELHEPPHELNKTTLTEELESHTSIAATDNVMRTIINDEVSIKKNAEEMSAELTEKPTTEERDNEPSGDVQELKGPSSLEIKKEEEEEEIEKIKSADEENDPLSHMKLEGKSCQTETKCEDSSEEKLFGEDLHLEAEKLEDSDEKNHEKIQSNDGVAKDDHDSKSEVIKEIIPEDKENIEAEVSSNYNKETIDLMQEDQAKATSIEISSNNEESERYIEDTIPTEIVNESDNNISLINERSTSISNAPDVTDYPDESTAEISGDQKNNNIEIDLNESKYDSDKEITSPTLKKQIDRNEDLSFSNTVEVDHESEDELSQNESLNEAQEEASLGEVQTQADLEEFKAELSNEEPTDQLVGYTDQIICKDDTPYIPDKIKSELPQLGPSFEAKSLTENINRNSKGLVKVLGEGEEEKSHGNEKKRKPKRKEWKRQRSREKWEPRSVSPHYEEDKSYTKNQDSSQLQDSGIEPSPQQERKRSIKGMRPKSRSRIPRMCNANQDEYDIDSPLSTVSVTQAVQYSVRKYHLERRIFHQLLELKRLQIRAGRSSEGVLVKRLVDDYRRAGLMLGLQQYNGVYTFRAFERYLYEQLRLLQSSEKRIIPRLRSSDDLERLNSALRKSRVGQEILTSVPSNPALCTLQTHRCHHATHAYTGIPCAAYIRKDHHTMAKPANFLPKLVDGERGDMAKALRFVDPTTPLTLELSHGSEKQVITLPTEKLDKSKRYFVTFTIKSGNANKTDVQPKHTHPSSV